MKCVHKFGTGRHKRQADITLLFQYIYTLVTDVYKEFLKTYYYETYHLANLKKSMAKKCHTHTLQTNLWHL